MLRIYQSNHLEQLASWLAELLRKTPLPPLHSEQVIVHSRTMSRWLSLQLADRLGICANIDFPFPAAFMWRLLCAALPEAPAQSLYESGVLRWRIMALLEELQDTPAFAPVRTSLAGGAGDEQCFQLATQLAELFNRYLIYRPEWVERWSRKKGANWQEILWYRLVRQPGGDLHWGSLRGEFLRRLGSGETVQETLPPRVALFGSPDMSPGYLEVLTALGKRIDVYLFCCNPCRHYWGDVAPRKVVLRREAGAQVEPGALYLETGNRLLASLGRQGRDFFDALLEYPAEEHEHFVAAGADSRLHKLQNDILDLREHSATQQATADRNAAATNATTNPQSGTQSMRINRNATAVDAATGPQGGTQSMHANRNTAAADAATGPQGGTQSMHADRNAAAANAAPSSQSDAQSMLTAADTDTDTDTDTAGNAKPAATAPSAEPQHTAPNTPAAEDDSIQIHVCHNPIREIEVLHDRLLHLFAQHPQLNPSDVTVMIPQLEEYAPLIDGVFGAAQGDTAIPFSISGWSMRRRRQAADAILRLLRLPQGRFGVREILAILECPDVSERFDLENSLSRILSWLGDSGVRWGWDGGDRKRLELPPDEHNTWQTGLDSLLLGYALPDEQKEAPGGLAPTPGIEGGNAALAGRLYDAAARLAALREQLREERKAPQWRTLLRNMGRDFLSADACQLLDGAARALRESCARADHTSRFSAATLQSFVAQHLQQSFPSYGDGVHFRRLEPLHCTPCKLLCLVGMNDDAFPRRDVRAHYDLMAQAAPRRGDPERRAAHRYVFLECLLNARQLLYISYTGRAARDNSVRPPSVLVEELCDALKGTPEGGGLPPHTLEHPLQPFSRRYFDGGPKFFSYARAFCPAPPASAAANQPQQQQEQASQEATEDFSPRLQISLPEPQYQERTVNLRQLLRFFRNTTKYLLWRRLGIRLLEEENFPPEHFPFHPTGLAAYQLRSQLFEDALENPPRNTAQSQLAHRTLPPGQAGAVLLEQLRDELQPLIREVRGVRKAASQGLELALDFAHDLRLEGHLNALYDGGLMLWSPHKFDARQRLDLEIQHLALCCAAPTDRKESLLLTYDSDTGVQRFTLPVLEERVARDRMQQLLLLYQQGQRRPLHFFPKSSYAYAQNLAAGNDKAQDKAQSKVRAAWNGAQYGRAQGIRGEKQDTYLHFVFHHAQSPENSKEFQTLARQLFSPAKENS